MEFLFADWLGTPAWFWLAFLGLVVALTAFDLGVLHKEDKAMGIGESLKLTAFYITIALLFGFVAKEIVIGSLAVIYGGDGEQLVQLVSQQVGWMEAYSFMLFALIYTPCLSTIATIRNESRSAAFTTLAVVWPLALAWVVSYAFYQTALRFAH